jgi:hypothetical protein
VPPDVFGMVLPGAVGVVSAARNGTHCCVLDVRFGYLGLLRDGELVVVSRRCGGGARAICDRMVEWDLCEGL